MNANKKILLLISVVIVILFFGSFLLSHSSKIGPSTTSAPTVTPLPYIPPSTQPLPSNTGALLVTDVAPKDKSTGAVADENIVVTFNKDVASSDIVFSIKPNTSFIPTLSGNTLAITFSKALAYNMTYVYTVSSKQNNLLQTFSFTTASANDPIYHDNAAQQNADYSKQNEPDLYLYNSSSYSTADFSISGIYKDSPTGHFAFTVYLNGSDKNKDKQEFLDWVRSIGLTDQQIQTLDITYQ